MAIVIMAESFSVPPTPDTPGQLLHTTLGFHHPIWGRILVAVGHFRERVVEDDETSRVTEEELEDFLELDILVVLIILEVVSCLFFRFVDNCRC